MKLSRAAPLILLLPVSCNQDTWWEAANKRYLMMIGHNAPKADLCAESKRDAKEALNALDEVEYDHWLQMEKEDCGAPS